MTMTMTMFYVLVSFYLVQLSHKTTLELLSNQIFWMNNAKSVAFWFNALNVFFNALNVSQMSSRHLGLVMYGCSLIINYDICFNIFDICSK